MKNMYSVGNDRSPTRQRQVEISGGEYKVDLTRHPKFPLAFGELASSRFPH